MGEVRHFWNQYNANQRRKESNKRIAMEKQLALLDEAIVESLAQAHKAVAQASAGMSGKKSKPKPS
jgi:hypothetical protein